MLSRPWYRRILLCFSALLLALVLGIGYRRISPTQTETLAPDLAATQAAAPVPTQETPDSPPFSALPTVAQPAADAIIRVDAAQDVHPISSLIYGLSGAPAEILRALRPALNSWGGNPSTRYNWKLGNAWNAGSDWLYHNGDYGYTGRSASDDFVADTLASGAAVRLALPTLGWVAADTTSCSFALPGGGCGDAGKANCERPGAIADPARANVRSDVRSAVEWVQHLRVAKSFDIRFFAMDNEPELWGSTHYDVHPTCTTYDEILDKYLEYATAVRTAAPDAKLLGPVTCCWYFYWNSAAGQADKAAHGNQDFLPWFVQAVRKHDEQIGARTLDVLDIHYYPEGLYNDTADSATAAWRLRSTRSLWDREYVDESWIGEAVALIPRMKRLIDEQYPGTRLGISEWNWGADKTMNGALAIADVLGIFGREDVYLASYWRYPEQDSPGFYAFKMFTNYDDRGGHFGDTSVRAASSMPDQLSAYASLDSATSRLTVLLINKDPQRSLTADLVLNNFTPAQQPALYRYSESMPHTLVREPFPFDGSLTLPAYSITLLVAEAQRS